MESKSLEYDVDILDVNFSRTGRYFIKLAVQSLQAKDYSKIFVRRWPNQSFVCDYEALTDVTVQKNNDDVVTFDEHKFTFIIPQGFCRNNENHDVYLLVEAFSMPDSDKEIGQKMGENKVPIFPQANTSHFYDAGNSSKEILFQYSDTVNLLRSPNVEKTQMHCGTMRCTFSMRVVSPELITSTSLLLADSPDIDIEMVASKQLEMKSSPLPEFDQSTNKVDQTWRSAVRQGNEQYDVIVHGACCLPSTSKGVAPHAYVTLTTDNNTDTDEKKIAKTHACVSATHSPYWQEIISVDTWNSKAEYHGLILMVGDAVTKECLVNYCLPTTYLVPHHQYHLELLMPQVNANDVKLYVSITRRHGLPGTDTADYKFSALEVCLYGVQKELRNPPGFLLAVARVVHDYWNYGNRLHTVPKATGVTMTSVTFPHPHPSSFQVPSSTFHGFPQMSLIGRPMSKPVWDNLYVFGDSQEKATMFTPTAALVLEYYVANEAETNEFWRVQSPVGFSAVMLDQSMYSLLIEESSRDGIRLDGVPIQGSNMATLDDCNPTVGMAIKLAYSTEADTHFCTENSERLPGIPLRITNGLAHVHEKHFLKPGQRSLLPDDFTPTFDEDKRNTASLATGSLFASCDVFRSTKRRVLLDLVSATLPHNVLMFVQHDDVHLDPVFNGPWQCNLLSTK